MLKIPRQGRRCLRSLPSKVGPSGTRHAANDELSPWLIKDYDLDLVSGEDAGLRVVLPHSPGSLVDDVAPEAEVERGVPESHLDGTFLDGFLVPADQRHGSRAVFLLDFGEECEDIVLF